MWYRNLFLFLFFIFLVLLQISFTATDAWEGKINLTIAFLIGCSLFYSLNYALILLVIGGYLLDLYSSFNFGVISLTLFLSVILIYLLVKKNLVNTRSFIMISFLILLATVFYNFILFFFTYIFYYFNFNDFFMSWNFLNISWQVIINIIAVLFIYSFRNFFAKYLIFYEKK